MEKNRYLLFGFYNQYPSGGMTDAIDSFNEKKELIELNATNDYFDIYQVFDTHTFKTKKYYKGDSLEDILDFD